MCQRVKITKKVVINFLGRFSFSTFITTTSLIWVYFWHFSFYFLFLYFRRLLLRFSFFSRGWLVELLYFCYIHLHPIISIYFFGIFFFAVTLYNINSLVIFLCVDCSLLSSHRCRPVSTATHFSIVARVVFHRFLWTHGDST